MLAKIEMQAANVGNVLSAVERVGPDAMPSVV
jgi:hypothetical protein